MNKELKFGVILARTRQLLILCCTGFVNTDVGTVFSLGPVGSAQWWGSAQAPPLACSTPQQ